MAYKPVSVSKYGFMFCRFTVAMLVWAAFVLRNEQILYFVGIIMFLSAILKIKRAPLVVFYKHTAGMLFKRQDEIVNENAMRFAHTLATVLTGICLIFILFIDARVGWFLTLVFAILKTVSAVGFCPASKLYDCAQNNNCCAFAKKKMTHKSC